MRIDSVYWDTDVFAETIIITFLPAILAWFASLIGFSLPLDDIKNIFIFLLFWTVVELIVFIFLLRYLKNKDKLFEKILSITFATLITRSFIPFPPYTSLGKGTAAPYLGITYDVDEDEAEILHYIGVCVVSMLIAAIPLLLAGIFVFSVYISG
jgi:hypothetical protein